MGTYKKIKDSLADFEAYLSGFVERHRLSQKEELPKTSELLDQRILPQFGKLKKLIEKQNERFSKLKNENNKLQKLNDSIVSDNYLLEYKKKDLLVLADELEEANEQIERKNNEIQSQAHELEAQKDAIQDQADYLHDANERIISMHNELQSQRDEIWQKNKELINLNSEKNNLIGIVAHDLKSPLNQIGGLITLLKLTANLEGEPAQFIDTMGESVNRLNGMIEKILNIEAIESQQLNVSIERVNLSEILNLLAENYRINANEKQIDLRTDIPLDNTDAMLDGSYVSQVYENLISNAIKFSPTKKQILVSLKEHNSKWRCEIKDNGPGISEEDQKKLFGKFQKLSAKPTGNETSTGLGLSIVKKYVDAMDGEIWCESKLNHGASFIVEFNKAD